VRALAAALVLLAAAAPARADSGMPPAKAGAPDAKTDAKPDAKAEVKVVRFDKLGFEARFPYTAKASSSEDGDLVSASNDGDTIAYMVSVFSLPDEVLKAKPPAQILEDAMAGAAKNVNGTIKTKSPTKLGKQTGMLFVVETAEFVADCRIYLVGHRIYLPMVVYQPKLTLPLGPDAFHTSLKLFGKP
jgi:hypothetical protein